MQPVFLNQEQAIDYAKAVRAFARARFAFSIQVATWSGRSISAKRTENCRAGEIHSGVETNCSDVQNLCLHKNQSFFYDPI